MIAKGCNSSHYKIGSDSVSAVISTLGATVLAINVPSSSGKVVDIVLGYTSDASQIAYGDYIGSTVGRCANRIRQGKFCLEGNSYQVSVNDGVNSLHGGNIGLDKKVWTVTQYSSDSVTMTCRCEHLEEGYPNCLDITAIFSVEGNSLLLQYFATTDKVTLCNIATHSYFNLNGEDDGSCLDNELTIYADSYMPVDDTLIPLGIAPVDNTPFDFRHGKKLGQDIDSSHSQIRLVKGFDHNYCVMGEHVATAYSHKTGITMDVYSNQCGVQLYTGNFLAGNKGKSVYDRHSGFCLETQRYPDNINNGLGDSVILHKGEEYYHYIKYVFTVK